MKYDLLKGHTKMYAERKKNKTRLQRQLKEQSLRINPHWSFLWLQKSCKVVLPWRSSQSPQAASGEQSCRLWASKQGPAHSASNLLLTKPTDGWAIKEGKGKDVESEGFSRWQNGKGPTCQCRIRGFDPWVRKIPWRKAWQPTPVFFPGESHGQRSLAGCSPWGHRESDSTEWLSMHTSEVSCAQSDLGALDWQ